MRVCNLYNSSFRTQLRRVRLQDMIQQRFAPLLHILIGHIKISCIPGIRNISGMCRKVQQKRHLAFRIRTQNPQHIPAVPAVHTDDIIVFFIIGFRHLHGAMVTAPDSHLFEFTPRSVMNPVADFLAAGRRGVDVEAGGKVALVDHILHDVLSHGAAADVAVANK